MGDGEQAREAAAWIEAAPGRWVLGSADLMVRCFDPAKMENLGNRHRTDWLLAGPQALKPACRGLSPPWCPSAIPLHLERRVWSQATLPPRLAQTR